MTIKAALARLTQQEDLNFLLTNRIPRRWLTQFMGWFSQIEHPWVRDASLRIWRLFGDLDLSDAQHTSFKSLHDCFVRELKPGARPVDPDPGVMTSPCDGIIGAHGLMDDTTLLQAKGFPYSLLDLLGDPRMAEQYRNGCYVTLRIKASMYHRFHAPHDCRVQEVTYISGDTWNVNPIALRRIEALFCKNERAVIRTRLLANNDEVALVPVAAILVASIRLHFLDVLLSLKHRGPNLFRCNATFDKGEEMGWFQHGSTIIVLAPADYRLCEGLREGDTVRVGTALLRLPVKE